MCILVDAFGRSHPVHLGLVVGWRLHGPRANITYAELPGEDFRNLSGPSA